MKDMSNREGQDVIEELRKLTPVCQGELYMVRRRVNEGRMSLRDAIEHVDFALSRQKVNGQRSQAEIDAARTFMMDWLRERML